MHSNGDISSKESDQSLIVKDFFKSAPVPSFGEQRKGEVQTVLVNIQEQKGKEAPVFMNYVDSTNTYEYLRLTEAIPGEEVLVHLLTGDVLIPADRFVDKSASGLCEMPKSFDTSGLHTKKLKKLIGTTILQSPPVMRRIDNVELLTFKRLMVSKQGVLVNRAVLFSTDSFDHRKDDRVIKTLLDYIEDRIIGDLSLERQYGR